MSHMVGLTGAGSPPEVLSYRQASTAARQLGSSPLRARTPAEDAAAAVAATLGDTPPVRQPVRRALLLASPQRDGTRGSGGDQQGSSVPTADPSQDAGSQQPGSHGEARQQPVSPTDSKQHPVTAAVPQRRPSLQDGIAPAIPAADRTTSGAAHDAAPALAPDAPSDSARADQGPASSLPEWHDEELTAALDRARTNPQALLQKVHSMLDLGGNFGSSR